MNAGDSLYVYIASHGFRDPSINQPSALWIGSAYLDGSSYLVPSELATYLNRNDVAKWVFIDSCKAGGFWSDGNFNLGNLSNISFFAAADENNLMHYDLNGLPYFGMAVTWALRRDANGYYNTDSNPRDGIISYNELLSYIQSYNCLTQGTVGLEGELGDGVILSPSMWAPVGTKSSDFTGTLKGVITCSTAGDFSPSDYDVDGSDLAKLIANQSLLDITTFAQQFGKTSCP
jgi:hypothetical protein